MNESKHWMSKHGFNWLAYRECQSILALPVPENGELYCPAVFDLWLCWNYTLAGSRVYKKCPHELIPGFSENALAEKWCMDDGTWFRNRVNKSWTDYRQCISDHQDNYIVLLVYIVGYVLSAILLASSMVIFSCFRQLRCTRTTLHMHLFASYIMAGLLWTVSYTNAINNPASIRDNEWWCKMIHVLTQCISLCNYTWMFCEGLFLHTSIVLAFYNEKNLLRICCIIGWGLPVIPAFIHAIVRTFMPNLNREKQ